MRANSFFLLRLVSMLGFTENPTKMPQTNEARANFLPRSVVSDRGIEPVFRGRKHGDPRGRKPPNEWDLWERGLLPVGVAVPRGQSIFAGWHCACSFVSYKWDLSLCLLMWQTELASPGRQIADMTCIDKLGSPPCHSWAAMSRPPTPLTTFNSIPNQTLRRPMREDQATFYYL